MSDDWRARAARGALPTRHLLRAAIRSARLLPEGGTAREIAHGSYGVVPTGGIYSSADLRTGEDILTSAGLLRRDADALVPSLPLLALRDLPDEAACNAIVCALLDEVRPLWLIAATSDGIVEMELIPDSALRELDHLDPDERERMLIALGRKFAKEDREETGALAEEALCEEFRRALIGGGAPHLTSAVRRVSLESDDLGYDITSPRVAGGVLRVESKGTRGSGPIWRVFITRNEARQAGVDTDWVLVISAVGPTDDVQVVGWIAGAAIGRFLPRDPEQIGLWETAVLLLPSEELTPGLPSV